MFEFSDGELFVGNEPDAVQFVGHVRSMTLHRSMETVAYRFQEMIESLGNWAVSISHEMSLAFMKQHHVIWRSIRPGFVAVALEMGDVDMAADFVPTVDYERLARDVVRVYNWRHPRRKRSWRRLTRPEKRIVVERWLEEVGA